MTLIDWVNVSAILLSPLVAVLVSIWVQNRKEKRQHKLFVFGKLMETRHMPLSEEAVRALNMIDVIFYDKARVRQLWREYFDMVSNPGLSNENGFKLRQDKLLELLHAMGKTLGYGRAISHLDVNRVYYPVGLGAQLERSEQIANELLRVLKSSEGYLLAPRRMTPGGSGPENLGEVAGRPAG